MEPQDARKLSPDALFDLRTRVVAAVRGGMSQAEAARVVAAHRSAVNRWCQAGGGPDALRPRRRGPQADRRHRMSVISTVTNAGTLRFSVFAGRFTAAVFLAFLARLRRSTTGVVFLIADGHPVHRSRGVAEWVAAHADRLRLFLLPPYCPELNPTEYLNNAIKGTVPRVRRAAGKKGLAGQVRSDLRIAQKRKGVLRRIFKAKPVRYAA
jgi:transposase